MDTALFLEQFGHLASSPDGVQKLRSLILDLAVRGKLDEQNSDDEPAVQVFNRLGLNKLEPQDFVGNTDELKELPNGWICKQIDSIAEVKGGKRIPIGHTLLDTPTPYIYIRVTDMKNGTISREGLKYISAETRHTIEKYTISSEDLYITIAGTIGSVGFVPSEFDGMNLTENAAKITLRSRDLIHNIYMYHVLSSRMLQSQFQDKLNQMAQPKLSLRSIRGSFIPIPPLGEQQRIVARVDELMELCDQLEAEQAERDYLRERATKSTLYHLTGAPGKAEARKYWHYAEQHFPELFDRVSTVEDLRAMILQLAVQGRLVPQNPDDEPASELLKRIEAEKKRLVKAGEIKPSKPLPPITEDDIPYNLPKTWEWVRLNKVSLLITSGSRNWAKYYSKTGAKFLRMGNLSKNSYIMRLNDIQYVQPPSDGEGTRTQLEQDDILISVTGDVGMLGLIPPNFGEAYINQHTCLLRLMLPFRNRYIAEYLRSSFAQYQFNAPQRGVKNSFRLGDVREMIVPVPPLAEQECIVAKVGLLMQLCDQLEEEVEQSRYLSGRLFDSIIHHMFLETE